MRKVVAILAVVAGLILPGCENDQGAEAPSPSGSVVEVVMKGMEFSPSSVEISIGDTIEWKNEDLTPHTATSPDFGDSGSLSKGESWRHTFSEPGDFPYVCTFHPDMTGEVIVKD